VTTHHARELIRNAVTTLCRETGARSTLRPVIRSEPSGPQKYEPEPLAAITAARHLEHAARAAVRDHARTAREDGCTWTLIAEAMGYADRPSLAGTSTADRAFLALASDLGHGPAFTWTCPSCLGVIVDYGPEAGHPADQERGHADSCGRFTETVRAYEASWGDGGDEAARKGEAGD
jgi:hypothetical protein